VQVAFVCPACRGTINAPASLEGEAYPCPKCKADVERWPAPVNPPASPARAGSPPPAEKAAWYYSVSGTRRGPVTSGQLKSLVEGAALRPTDLVWREGMASWVEAGTIPELFPQAAPTKPAPPPVPAPVPVAQPPQRAEPDDEEEEEEERRPRRRGGDRQAVQVNVHVERDEDERRPRRRRGSFRCPFCGSTARPLVRRQVSAAGWIVFALLLFFTIIFCFIGLFIQEDVYTCRDCGARVGG
jgi:hypothetical protein